MKERQKMKTKNRKKGDTHRAFLIISTVNNSTFKSSLLNGSGL